MPNASAFEGALEVAKNNPGLGVGVHLSLVAERCIAPVEKIRGLAGSNGALPASYGAFTKAYFLRRFGPREIRAEVEAQVQRVLDAGIHPTHLDSHQHVHVLPGFFDIVVETAKAAGIPVVRVPLERGGPGPGGISGRGAQMFVLSTLCRYCVPRLRAAGLRSADHFWGVGVSGKMDESNLETVLRRLGSGVNEIMCHPGFGDPATEAKYRWGYAWDDEAAALRSDAIEHIIDELQIKLASFKDAWEMEG